MHPALVSASLQGTAVPALVHANTAGVTVITGISGEFSSNSGNSLHAVGLLSLALDRCYRCQDVGRDTCIVGECQIGCGTEPGGTQGGDQSRGVQLACQSLEDPLRTPDCGALGMQAVVLPARGARRW